MIPMLKLCMCSSHVFTNPELSICNVDFFLKRSRYKVCPWQWRGRLWTSRGALEWGPLDPHRVQKGSKDHLELSPPIWDHLLSIHLMWNYHLQCFGLPGQRRDVLYVCAVCQEAGKCFPEKVLVDEHETKNLQNFPEESINTVMQKKISKIWFHPLQGHFFDAM